MTISSEQANQNRVFQFSALLESWLCCLNSINIFSILAYRYLQFYCIIKLAHPGFCSAQIIKSSWLGLIDITVEDTQNHKHERTVSFISSCHSQQLHIMFSATSYSVIINIIFCHSHQCHILSFSMSYPVILKKSYPVVLSIVISCHFQQRPILSK